MNSSLVFKDGKVEKFADKEQFTKRLLELNSANVEFNFQINSSQGREYFENPSDFYSRLGELKRNKLGVFPLVQTEPGCWNSLNLHRKLIQLKGGETKNL